MTNQPVEENRKLNLWTTVKGPFKSHGTFDKEAVNKSLQLYFVMHPWITRLVDFCFHCNSCNNIFNNACAKMKMKQNFDHFNKTRVYKIPPISPNLMVQLSGMKQLWF